MINNLGDILKKSNQNFNIINRKIIALVIAANSKTNNHFN